MLREYKQTEIGRIIRARRKGLGLTLKECAEKIGISRQAVSQIEFGKNRGGNSKLIEDLAQFLDLDERELLLTRPERRLCQKKRETPLGEFWTKMRIKQHLTMKQLATLAGVSEALVSENELGKHRPKNSTLKKIAWALECKIPR
ncbi:MAG: helix-turn-helix domain-containing protein [bacterium]|nr:helix-turn-helix domain-containing protein [bacterium]